ncbi:hypothetical protein [Microvirga sp. G4-2]|uniref:hypothetical protein n=1 Tax=Microvirga sp. G4-2 TaxID=3434467 RepID=UPI0040446ED1
MQPGITETSGAKHARDAGRLEAAVRLGVAMRQAQAAYFKDRTRENLIASKVAEKEFDTAARVALEEMEGH